jgi:release factor glutamine methyltransferase
VTIREALSEATQILQASHIPDARLTAEVLLAHLLTVDREHLFSHSSDPLDPAKREAFDFAVWKRTTGEPLQYVTGVQEFYGRRFTVNPDVLIPRSETEHLIDAVLELDPREGNRIVDVGTGSGCIAVSLALEIEGAHVFAGDISEAALRVARLNAIRLDAQLRLVCMELLDAVEGPFDFVVSNPPYIPSNELAGLQREVREHEPLMALVPPGDPLELYRRLVESAHLRLRRGGYLIMEIGMGMEKDVLALLNTGWWKLPTKLDLQGIPRTVIARRE